MGVISFHNYRLMYIGFIADNLLFWAVLMADCLEFHQKYHLNHIENNRGHNYKQVRYDACKKPISHILANG